MCLRRATQPSELKTFTGAAMTPAAADSQSGRLLATLVDAGLGGEWRFVDGQSSETEYVFAFAPPGKPVPAAKAAAFGKAASGRKAAPASKAAHAGKGRKAGRQGTASEGNTRPARRKQPAAEEALTDEGSRGRKSARR